MWPAMPGVARYEKQHSTALTAALERAIHSCDWSSPSTLLLTAEEAYSGRAQSLPGEPKD